MKEDSALGRGFLASILIAMTLVASCERKSGGSPGNTGEPGRERPAHSPVPTPPSEDPHLRVADLARRNAGGNLFLQHEVSKLVADYAETSGLSLGESCLRLLEEAGEDLQPSERETLLTILDRALLGNYQEQNVLALGMPPGMPRTRLISGNLSSMRRDLAIDEMKALHEGLGPGRDRTSAAEKLALATMDRDGLRAAAELASELELPKERKAAFVAVAFDFVVQGLDQESDEHRAGYERLMELAKAEGESIHRSVYGRFHSVPVEVITPEEFKRRKAALKLPDRPESE